MAVKILYVTLAVLLLNLVIDLHTGQWASLFLVMVSIVGVCFWIKHKRKAVGYQRKKPLVTVQGFLMFCSICLAMTLHQFNHLPYEAQLATVHETGTYLATRQEGWNDSVLLYHLPVGLFAELCYEVETNHITHLYSFTDSARLTD